MNKIGVILKINIKSAILIMNNFWCKKLHPTDSILFQFFNQDLMQKVLNIFKRKSQKAKARNLRANTLPDKYLTKFGRYFLQIDL